MDGKVAANLAIQLSSWLCQTDASASERDHNVLDLVKIRSVANCLYSSQTSV